MVGNHNYNGLGNINISFHLCRRSRPIVFVVLEVLEVFSFIYIVLERANNK